MCSTGLVYTNYKINFFSTLTEKQMKKKLKDLSEFKVLYIKVVLHQVA